MEKARKVVTSSYPPRQTNVVWIDLSGETPVEKLFINGKWVAISGGGGSGVYHAAGNATLLTLGSLDASHEGFVYNMTAAFTTTSDFIEGTGKDYPIGSNVVIVNVGTTNKPTYKYDVLGGFVDLDSKADKILVDDTMPQKGGMLPNVVYQLGLVENHTVLNTIRFSLANATDNTIANIWMWTFSTGDTAPTINWPLQITMWIGGDAPDIEANKYYEVSVMNGVGTIISADIPQEEETEVEP